MNHNEDILALLRRALLAQACLLCRTFTAKNICGGCCGLLCDNCGATHKCKGPLETVDQAIARAKGVPCEGKEPEKKAEIKMEEEEERFVDDEEKDKRESDLQKELEKLKREVKELRKTKAGLQKIDEETLKEQAALLKEAGRIEKQIELSETRLTKAELEERALAKNSEETSQKIESLTKELELARDKIIEISRSNSLRLYSGQAFSDEFLRRLRVGVYTCAAITVFVVGRSLSEKWYGAPRQGPACGIYALLETLC